MKYIVFSIAVLLFSCRNDVQSKNGDQSNTEDISSTLVNRVQNELEVYDFNGFNPLLEKSDNIVRVINFWATWCAPCIKELPHFEKLNREYKNQNVEVILVSLDFPHLYEKKLKPYILKNNLQSKVIALDDPDMNSWIPKVSEDWTGSIPATVIYKNDRRKFYEQSFNYNELETELKLFLN